MMLAINDAQVRLGGGQGAALYLKYPPKLKTNKLVDTFKGKKSSRTSAYGYNRS